MKGSIVKEQNGTVKFLPHRGVYVGYWNGKIQCTKKNARACTDFLNAKFGPNAPVLPTKVPAAKPRVAFNLDGTQHRILADVNAEWAKAQQIWPELQGVPVPTVSFYHRGTIAGKAWSFGHRVAFNTILAAENPDRFINTVKHELAHIITNRKYLFAKAHGPEFKSVLIAMGGDGKRCHDYDVQNVRRSRTAFEYKCACKTHMMSSVRHNKAQRGVTYSCKRCRQPVRYTGKTVFA
jgi:SprT protein